VIGLGSYAFFWQQSDRVEAPLSLIDVLERSRELGAEVFQICDWAPLERMTARELDDAATAARRLGISIQLGTKGVEPDRLARFLDLAERFSATLVRSMAASSGSVPPTREETIRMLELALPAYRAAGVTLALETYELMPTATLIEIIEHVGSDHLGICLDPANVVAALESPRATVELCAELTRNVHAKDFAFARQPGWVGFTYSGAPMGEGLHDYPHLLATVQPRERGIDEIVEHWLPWQGDPESTVEAERAWTTTALDYLRSTR
jgi:3-oxoisoapionate decarboxylase